MELFSYLHYSHVFIPCKRTALLT